MYASIMMRFSPILKYQLAIDIHVISTVVAASPGITQKIDDSSASKATHFLLMALLQDSASRHGTSGDASTTLPLAPAVGGGLVFIRVAVLNLLAALHGGERSRLGAGRDARRLNLS